MILQKDLTGELLAMSIKSLMDAPEKITAMEKAAKTLVRGDAAAKMVDLIKELVSRP
jgi:UDP-N-acetylglucosamine:LPS N-acetylglucosamine transferase